VGHGITSLAVRRFNALVTGRTLIGCIRDKQSSLISSSEQDMSKGVDRLFSSEVAFLDGALKHCADSSQSIEAFEFAPSDPAQYGRSVDEEYPLDMRR
jgi:hypothetical protein